jgi:hypothetical protein
MGFIFGVSMEEAILHSPTNVHCVHVCVPACPDLSAGCSTNSINLLIL